jgi:hypothetical protein
MNERIRLLAEQAGFAYEPSETLQKFAELIVQECTNFLKDTMDDHFAAEQLEEHFGVEE